LRRYRPHLLVVCLVAALHLAGLSTFIDRAISDVRAPLLPRAATGDVVIVAIDPPSLDRIGVWPWPRKLHGEIIRQLEKAGAAEIYFDIDFSSASNPADDALFAESLKGAASSIVLPTFQQRVGGTLHVNRPQAQFSGMTWPALVNVTSDSDGIVRSYPIGDRVDGAFVPSMASVIAGKIDKDSSPFRIDFGIRSQTIPAFSYADVLDGKPEIASRLKGKKVVIGATAIELGDRFNIPNGQVVSGPMLQALAAESIIQDRALRPASPLFALLAIAAVIALMVLSWNRPSAARKIIVLSSVGILAEAAALFLHAREALILPTADLHLAIAGYFAAIALHEIDFRGLLSSIANARFERIAMSLGDGLVCANTKNEITVWNRAAEAIFGYRASEISGSPLARLFVPEAESILLRATQENAASGTPSTQQPVIELAGLRKNGEIFPAEVRFSRWTGPEGMQVGAVVRDISERKREAERIRYLAEFDTLTGLANRHTLQVRLRDAIEACKDSRFEVALIVVGIDRFQQINDVHGHVYGDKIIKATGERIATIAKSCELIARLGADEFAVVLFKEYVRLKTNDIARSIVEAFQQKGVQVDDHVHRVKVSVGVAIYDPSSHSANDMLGNAHLALSRAKKSDASHCVFFHPNFREELQTRLSLEAELYLALERNEFELFYQPQVRLSDGQLTGAEALIRWRHPERGLVPPGEFMPVVNTSPVSDGVANWVLATAARQAREWFAHGHEVRVGINLSPSQLQNGDLSLTVKKLLDNLDCPARLIELEVTEDILLGNDDCAAEILGKLRDLGVSVAFDDFGTGYASLSYLKKFPLDTLKVDRSFVSNLWDDPHNIPIVNMTAGLCNALGLSLIAEGIEDERTARQLALMGCTEGQGYHFGRPMPAHEFAQKFLVRPTIASTAA
jgi:diguanylate cyclase (GGDEF)-like protein/PAS domain S-box-containing protein